MTDHEIERLACAFCDGILPKARWTHAAHFATAFWIMLRAPDLVAERDMPGMIARYNEGQGGVNSDSAGYHETITQASLYMARRVLAGLPKGATPAQAHAALMASPLREKDWPLSYWTRDRLMSVEARRQWVSPDVRPLPA